MNFRSWLRFLRPLRSSIGIAIYAFIAWSWGHALFRLDQTTARFDALVVALPLLLGLWAAGAAHEPLHLPLAAVLPDAGRRIRRGAALLTALLALALAAGVAWCDAAVSPFAVFGLAAALIAVPFLDRRTKSAGMAGIALAAVAWGAFMFAFARHLRPAMLAAPWAFFLGGVAIAAVSLARGFARRDLRARATTPFVSPQTTAFSVLFHRRLSTALFEQQALHLRRKEAPRHHIAWTVRQVGDSTLAWMRVTWHANFGFYRGRGFATAQAVMLPVLLVWLFLLPAFHPFIEFVSGRPFVVPDYWLTLANLPAIDATTVAKPEFARFFGAMLQPGFAALGLVAVAVPRFALPISRRRLARVVFGLNLVQIAGALVLPLAAIAFVSTIGQLVTQRLLPAEGMLSLFGVDLLLAVALPLLACLGTVRLMLLRIVGATVICVGICLAVLLRSVWLPAVLTPAGIAVALAAAAASVGVLWLALRRHYARSDLFTGPREMLPRPA